MDIPNLDYIKEIAEGSEEFEQKFIEILKSEFPKEKEEYFHFLVKGEQNEAYKVVHKIKHKFGILGMQNSYELAVKHEEYLKINNTELNNEFANILDVVEDFIVKIA